MTSHSIEPPRFRNILTQIAHHTQRWFEHLRRTEEPDAHSSQVSPANLTEQLDNHQLSVTSTAPTMMQLCQEDTNVCEPITVKRLTSLQHSDQTMQSNTAVLGGVLGTDKAMQITSQIPTQANTRHVNDTPVLEVQVSAVSCRNQRKTMEDYVSVHYRMRFPRAPAPFCEHDFGWFAVFDGHAGHECAEYMSKHMFDMFDTTFRGNDNTPQQALSDTLSILTNHWDSVHPDDPVGTCVVVVLLDWTTRMAYVLNLGDSRVGLWAISDSKTEATVGSSSGSSTGSGSCSNACSTSSDLDAPCYTTTDHDAACLSEEKLVTTLHNFHTGLPGIVTRRTDPTNNMQIGRVNGIIAVSRAMGNNSRELKGNLSRIPDIDTLQLDSVLQRQTDNDNENNSDNNNSNNNLVDHKSTTATVWFVIASDGLWDGVPPVQIGTILRHLQPDANHSVPNELAQNSIAHGIRDNISCITVRIVMQM